MDRLSEDQQSLLANWIRALQSEQPTLLQDDVLHLAPEYYQGHGGKNIELMLSSVGKEPAFGKEALYVRNMESQKPRPYGLSPEAKPISDMFKRLKDKAVFFKPSEQWATKSQAKTAMKLMARAKKHNKLFDMWADVEGRTKTLTARAGDVLAKRGATTRTELFERMLGKKSFDLGKMGRVIFPALLLAAFLKRQQGQGTEETS